MFTWKPLNVHNKSSEWELKEDNMMIDDEQVIANTFNSFFIDKISNLKDNIDKSFIEDPLRRLKSKMSN